MPTHNTPIGWATSRTSRVSTNSTPANILTPVYGPGCPVPFCTICNRLFHSYSTQAGQNRMAFAVPTRFINQYPPQTQTVSAYPKFSNILCNGPQTFLDLSNFEFPSNISWNPNQSVTTPKTEIKSLTITSAQSDFPWSVKIKSSPAKRITVEDVLREIHGMMHIPVTEGELRPYDYSGEIRLAREERLLRVFTTPHPKVLVDTESYPVKRVDYLGKAVMFDGLVDLQLKKDWGGKESLVAEAKFLTSKRRD